MNENYQRLRITFAKGECLRYISHLDLARTWERALRRAGIPVAYSQGFHPHPKIVLAAALAVGCTASSEVLDVTLTQAMPPDQVAQGLASQLPDGLAVVDVRPIYVRAPALPTLLRGADYEVEVESDGAVEEMQAQCRALLARESIPRVFRGKAYDLRPLVDGLEVVGVEGGYPLARMQLAAGQRGTGRPTEVLDELGWSRWPCRCHRQRLRLG
jgi:radical SAM-linked protein